MPLLDFLSFKKNKSKMETGPAMSEEEMKGCFVFPDGVNVDGRGKYYDGLCRYSIFEEDDQEALQREKDTLLQQIKEKKVHASLDRGIGVMMGLVVGDALGAPLEFSPIRYGVTELTAMGQKNVWEKEGYNRFKLKPGQWTDDASMSLCIADTLLVNGQFNPHDLRLRFWNWWSHGYNNAFGYDDDRLYSRRSVGLGGNIGASLEEFKALQTPYTTSGNPNTSGNGSLMRNGPVSVCYSKTPEMGMRVAYNQSKTTHQGTEAAECARLLTHICMSLIECKSEGGGDESEGGGVERMKAVLQHLGSTFTSDAPSVMCLARSEQEGEIEGVEDDMGKAVKAADRDWRWQTSDFKYAQSRANRQPGYVGSYCMDCLSMALHCVWTTTSFEEALLKTVNLRGDADTVGAVAGQIAGACYGVTAIPLEWSKCVWKWDRGGDIAVKAARLAALTPGQETGDGFRD